MTTKVKKLGLEIATKEEAFWMKVKKLNENVLESLEEEVKLKKALIEMCKIKIKESE